MTPLRLRALAVLATLAVLGLGLLHLRGTRPSYASQATLLATPGSAAQSRQGVDVERTSIVGTYATLLRTPATWRRAGDPDVRLELETDPTNAIMGVVAHGGPTVQLDLARLLAAARAGQSELRDGWRLDVLSQPSPAASTSMPRDVLLAAVIVLALVAGAAVLVVPRRLRGGGDVWALEPVPAVLRFQPTLVRLGPLTETTSLLQVWGCWHDARSRPVGRPELGVRDQVRQARLPLAAEAGESNAAPDPQEWHGAFGIPATLFRRLGPPELTLETPEGSFPLQVDAALWAGAAPEPEREREPAAASTSS